MYSSSVPILSSSTFWIRLNFVIYTLSEPINIIIFIFFTAFSLSFHFQDDDDDVRFKNDTGDRYVYRPVESNSLKEARVVIGIINNAYIIRVGKGKKQ